MADLADRPFVVTGEDGRVDGLFADFTEALAWMDREVREDIDPDVLGLLWRFEASTVVPGVVDVWVDRRPVGVNPRGEAVWTVTDVRRLGERTPWEQTPT